jgi:CheY-like chemotaxis protein
VLVQCPQCKTEFRLVEHNPDERVVKYLCPGCEDIVRIDLELDEVDSSSSSGSYRSIERKKTILVADDARRVLDRAEKVLTGAGYHVLLAGDGEQALQMAREQHPDLVVLDLLMPKLTGFDVLREIRQDERLKDTPVLAMSGVYKDVILGFLQELGAHGFLDKGQIEDSLVFRIQSLLESGATA